MTVRSPRLRLAATALAAVAAGFGVPAAASTDAGALGSDPALAAAGRLVQGPLRVMPTLDAARAKRKPTTPVPSPKQLAYGGGMSGQGVQHHPSVYLVFWGSQWQRNDPYADYEQRFFRGLYGRGDDWTTVATQYCDKVKQGAIGCSARLPRIGRPYGGGVLKGVWFDDSSLAIPTDTWPLAVNPLDSVAGEAVRAAAHFGHTTPQSNADSQYLINEPSGYGSLGFGAYCAYHSTVTSNYGSVVYVDLPYQTDQVSCGQNSVNPGAAGRYDGVSIVAGHEFMEALTDPFPSTGWLDASGEENGDKCQWIRSGPGHLADLRLSTGTFAVQSTWSNLAAGGRGGCLVHASGN